MEMEMEVEGSQGPNNSAVLLSPQHQDVSNTGPLSAIAALVQVNAGLMGLCEVFSVSNSTNSAANSLMLHKHEDSNAGRIVVRNMLHFNV